MLLSCFDLSKIGQSKDCNSVVGTKHMYSIDLELALDPAAGFDPNLWLKVAHRRDQRKHGNWTA